MLSCSISYINFNQEESKDTSEDGYGLEDGSYGDQSFYLGDNLAALYKLEKYMDWRN